MRFQELGGHQAFSPQFRRWFLAQATWRGSRFLSPRYGSTGNGGTGGGGTGGAGGGGGGGGGSGGGQDPGNDDSDDVDMRGEHPNFLFQVFS